MPAADEAAATIPRRARLDLLTPAEKAIVSAQYAVEGAGGSPRLTDAAMLLSQARDAVADHVEGISRATTGLSFGHAIYALKSGERVARAGWNGKGMFIVLMPPLKLPPYNTQGTERKVNDRTAKWIGEDQPLDCQPYLAMYNAQKQWQPGSVASQADMLADDWMIVAAGA